MERLSRGAGAVGAEVGQWAVVAGCLVKLMHRGLLETPLPCDLAGFVIGQCFPVWLGAAHQGIQRY
jgi:hypothetical protein